MVEKFFSREVNGIVYSIQRFSDDDKYRVYGKQGSDIKQIPEIAVFDKEQEALDYINNL